MHEMCMKRSVAGQQIAFPLCQQNAERSGQWVDLLYISWTCLISAYLVVPNLVIDGLVAWYFCSIALSIVSHKVGSYSYAYDLACKSATRELETQEINSREEHHLPHLSGPNRFPTTETWDHIPIQYTLSLLTSSNSRKLIATWQSRQ